LYRRVQRVVPAAQGVFLPLFFCGGVGLAIGAGLSGGLGAALCIPSEPKPPNPVFARFEIDGDGASGSFAALK